MNKTAKYLVALEVIDGDITQWVADWGGDPGRTCIEASARRYPSIVSATFGLAHARKYRDFESACIIEVKE